MPLSILSEPGFFCVSCLVVFRIGSNTFCFSPCICCEFAVFLRRSCLAVVQCQSTAPHSAGSQPAHTGTLPADLYIWIVPVHYCQFSSDTFCKIIPRSWLETSEGFQEQFPASILVFVIHGNNNGGELQHSCTVYWWSLQGTVLMKLELASIMLENNWGRICFLEISCKEMKLSFEPVCFISSQFSYVESLSQIARPLC